MARREHFEQQALPGIPAAAPSGPVAAPAGAASSNHTHQYVATGVMPEGANGPAIRGSVNRLRVSGQLDPRTASTIANGKADLNRSPLRRTPLGAMRSVWDSDRSDYKVSPFANDAFRKVGVVREIPLVGPNAVTAMQPQVNNARVDQIRSFPGLGQDPRFPGRELPGVLEANDGTNVVTQGNHRLTAAMEDANGQRAMLAPARVIPHDRLGDAMAVQEAGAQRYSRTRHFKDHVAATRSMTGDLRSTPRLAEPMRPARNV